MKITLELEVEPDELIDLVGKLLPTQTAPKATCFPGNYIERSKPTPGMRKTMRSLYCAVMAKGVMPSPPMPGQTWEDYFEPYELDENGPIVELFVPVSKNVTGSVSKEPKHVTRKK